MIDAPSLKLLATVNEKLDTLTFINVGYDDFQLVGNPLPWLYNFYPDFKPSKILQLKNIFVFLDDFLKQAQEQFGSGNTKLVKSGPWSEKDTANEERHLSALAVQVDDLFVVQISLITKEQRYHQKIFQKAREYSLEFERLNKDKENKEVLIHSIIHDLSGPLTSITGALNLISDFDLDKAEKIKFKKIVESQISIANEMIKGVFEILVSKDERAYPSSNNVEDMSLLSESINVIVENFSPAFKQQNVRLILKNKVSKRNIKVITENELFKRMLINLLENALRYSPVGSEVVIRVEEQEDKLCIFIEDEGAGVPDVLIDSLFQRSVGGQKYGGKAGFGLYYCQICLRKWGGEIKYIKPRSSVQSLLESVKGACFKISLQKVV